RDAGALGEEAAARRLADPARAAGDEDALALEPLHAATLLTLTIGIGPDSSTNGGYAHRVFPVTKGRSADWSPSGEENRVKKWGALAVAVLGAAVMLVSSAGAAEQSLAAKLSTRTGANLYLVQHGLNPAGFVVQRGTHNYAGPKCPGAGWNCTTAKRVLQIADHAGQANQATCSGGDSGGVVTDQPGDCEIVQSNSEGSNDATCDQEDTSATAQQRCVVFQTNESGSNTISVSQEISTSSLAGGTQNVHQYIGINQQNTSGNNLVQNAATAT